MSNWQTILKGVLLQRMQQNMSRRAGNFVFEWWGYTNREWKILVNNQNKKRYWVTKMYKTAGTVELKFLIFSLCDEQQRVWVHNWNHLLDFVLLMPLSFVFEYREHLCYWTANTSLTFKNVNLKSTSHFNCRHSPTELSHAGGRACCWLIACLVPQIQTSPVQCPSVTGQDTELLVAPQSLGKQ